MHPTPQRAQSQHIIRCIRCTAISLRLCWCYLQVNTGVCCSKQAPVHSERLLLKAVWHTTRLPLTHPDLSLLSPVRRLHPAPATLPQSCSLSDVTFPCSNSPSYPISLSGTTHFSSIRFPLPTSRSHIFSLDTFNTLLPLTPALFSTCDKSRVLLRCTGYGEL